MPIVSVLLPVREGAATLVRAAACVLGQGVRDLELLLILNAADEATRGAAGVIARADGRVRVISLPGGNLASALNVGLGEAACDLVARMDADDECPADRLEIQIAAMNERPELAALGSAWEAVLPSGDVLGVHHPPTDASESRWRLLMGNPFAHGSMLLRRRAVLAAGGYDERLGRAQDYDLWLRLAERGGVAAVPRILYRHHLRGVESYCSSPEQAACTAGLLPQRWAALPERDDPEVPASLAAAMDGRAHAALGSLGEAMTRRGPSRGLLTAYLWVKACVPTAGRSVADICRGARLRERAAELASRGVRRVWVYGAGAHTPGLLRVLHEARIGVEGLVDDAEAGELRHGFGVLAPGSVPRGAHVLLSSDAYEPALWRAAAPLRTKGVHVHCIYAADAAAA